MDGFWSNLGTILLSTFMLFAFVAYLFALFSIISDLFRDRSMSGGGKAVWLIFLIILPVLTALVYLIARGGGMNDRSQQAVSAQQAAVDAHIRQVAGGGGAPTPTDQIAQAKALLDSGAITKEEFDRLKEKALR